MAMCLERLNEHHAQLLRKQGWFVLDDFLSEVAAESLHSEILEAAKAGKLQQHRFQFGSSTFEKPHIFEADLHDDAMQSALPSFADLFFDDALSKRLDAILPELALEQGLKWKTTKVQFNSGQGGCFPCHYDNSGRPSNRSITCLVYLNPCWKIGDGGELVLHPFLDSQVIIAPLMGRAVFFKSDLVLHSVRPAISERLCFTIWVDSSITNHDSDCNLTAQLVKAQPETVSLLRRSPVQRAVSRAVYAEEYEDSLVACMMGGAGSEEMLAGHRGHVAQQARHPLLGPFVTYLRDLKVEDVVHVTQKLGSAEKTEVESETMTKSSIPVRL